VLAEEEAETLGDNPTPQMKELLNKRKSLGANTTVSKAALNTTAPKPAPKSAANGTTPKAKPAFSTTVSNSFLENMSPKPAAAAPAPKPAKAPKTPLKSRADSILAKSKEKAKVKAASPAKPPPARPEFPGRKGAKAFLVVGEPKDIRLPKLQAVLPAGAGFPGASLAVVHTPASWGPKDVYDVTTQVKKLNKEAGLGSFVLLVGTGLTNVHMNIEALDRHTKHTQFVTFHRTDAGDGETGKLKETCSYFIVAYFFPGCDQQGSSLPSKMVRDGFSTCFVTDSTVHLETSIIECFSEEGEWVLDLACGARQLTVAAIEQGRSAVALHSEAEPLEDLGNFLRTVGLESDPTYRQMDGVLLPL